MKLSIRLWIGIIIIATNYPLTWGAIALCVFLAAKTGNQKFLALSGIIYAISWGEFFLGIYLAGPEGVAIAKNFFKKILNIKHNK
jgi:hypothetical protein